MHFPSIRFRYGGFLLVMGLLAGCASAPKTGEAPEWTRAATRTVDNGYVVYVGVGEDPTLERAIFKAESTAIADLVNECSLAPKGARVEDHYHTLVDKSVWAYAKIGVTFEECEEAKKAVQPDDIRRLANVALTEQLKRYQDQYYTAAQEPGPETQPAASADGSGSGSSAAAPPPHMGGAVFLVSNDTQYFVVRQQVATFKEGVILAPPAAYPPGAPQTTHFVQTVQPAYEQTRVYEMHNPAIRSTSQSWSTVQANSRELPASVPRMKESAMPPNARRSFPAQSRPNTMQNQQMRQPYRNTYRRRRRHNN